jgi:hypothetical protein
MYGAVASEPDVEEALWLAFLIAYLSPLEAEDPFAGIGAARTSWTSDAVPEPDDVPTGPRTAHAPDAGSKTLLGYRAWAERAGSQEAAFTGEPHWTPKRRFARTFERLALPGFHRAARFDLLASLGRLGRLDVRAGSLFFSDDETTVGAKRVLGIGDPLLLDRRAAELAEACEVPLEALDLALFNWERDGERVRLGVAGQVPTPTLHDRIRHALTVG